MSASLSVNDTRISVPLVNSVYDVSDVTSSLKGSKLKDHV